MLTTISQAIQKRIQTLDFQNCKVRLTNVDCQSCGEDKIVAQVIGEMISQGSDEIKKFTQTFVLAPQPNGYYVLNDIFRYIIDEEEETQQPAAEEAAAAPAAEDTATEQEAVPEPEAAAKEAPIDAEVVAEKLEEDPEPAALKAADAEEEKSAPVEEEKPAEEEKVETPAEAEKEVETETLAPEAPKDPSPTPVASKQATPPKPAPVIPAMPMKPMSWASRAAAAAASAPRPAAPAAPAQKTAAPAQARAPAAAAPKAAAPVAAKAVDKENEAPQGGDGWQTAGAEAKKQTRPQQAGGPQEKEGTMAYIPAVSERIGAEALKATLSAFGQVTYFDINRQKSCAFVEFATPAQYQAAFNANPHKVGEDTIRVEPRRAKNGPYGPGNFAGRGGMNNRGRGGFAPGGQRGGRGGFNPARGGANQRGGPRGPAPAAAAPATSA